VLRPAHLTQQHLPRSDLPANRTVSDQGQPVSSRLSGNGVTVGVGLMTGRRVMLHASIARGYWPDAKLVCPYCARPPADGHGPSRDHVFVDAMGGYATVAAYKYCNNQLGSYVEVELLRPSTLLNLVRQSRGGGNPLRGVLPDGREAKYASPPTSCSWSNLWTLSPATTRCGLSAVLIKFAGCSTNRG
jgi:hypothetical protein